MKRMSVNIKIPHHPQLDNRFDPYRNCGVTSYAMVASWLGILPGNPDEQLEDEFYRCLDIRNMRSQVHADLIALARIYGIDARFRTDATWDEIRDHLRSLRPIIVTGYFTRSGHILVVRGFDDNGFIVNDPYGEWFSSGYNNHRSGENLHYSNQLMAQACGQNGDVWAHFIHSQPAM